MVSMSEVYSVPQSLRVGLRPTGEGLYFDSIFHGKSRTSLNRMGAVRYQFSIADRQPFARSFALISLDR